MTQLNAQNTSFREQGKLHPVRDLKLLPFLFVAKVIYGSLDKDAQNELLEMVAPRETLFRSVISGGITRFRVAQFLPLPAIRALNDFKVHWAS